MMGSGLVQNVQLGRRELEQAGVLSEEWCSSDAAGTFFDVKNYDGV
jgi:hypothetical protein